ncbi:MAG TPA: hypothetical protein PK156_49905, partial [Polyangium sp.]|nr:hypothetical protein [Polyangium sp.]
MKLPLPQSASMVHAAASQWCVAEQANPGPQSAFVVHPARQCGGVCAPPCGTMHKAESQISFILGQSESVVQTGSKDVSGIPLQRGANVYAEQKFAPPQSVPVRHPGDPPEPPAPIPAEPPVPPIPCPPAPPSPLELEFDPEELLDPELLVDVVSPPVDESHAAAIKPRPKIVK